MIALQGDPDHQTPLQLLDEIKGWRGDFQLSDKIPPADLPTFSPTPEFVESLAPIKVPEADNTKTALSTATPGSTATKALPTTASPQEPTLQADLSPQAPKGSNWMGFIAVGVVSLGAGASIGYFVAKRSR